jgi:hypothetical protein
LVCEKKSNGRATKNIVYLQLVTEEIGLTYSRYRFNLNDIDYNGDARFMLPGRVMGMVTSYENP